MNQYKDIAVSLSAVVVSVDEQFPQILMLEGPQGLSLPFGKFSPHNHRTLEQGLKNWVEESTGLQLAHIEQVYTFGNLYRSPDFENQGQRLLTISYLALTNATPITTGHKASWYNYYQFFPWEDHRDGTPESLLTLQKKLDKWARADKGRQSKIEFAFGGTKWDPDKALFRYELLYEAGLVKEAYRDWNDWGESERQQLPIDCDSPNPEYDSGLQMSFDHRRILASAIGRLRGKLRYRPLVFELLPQKFTLFQIQKVMEAIHGEKLHKQNFRRLLLSGEFIRECGEMDRSQVGRPAALYEFAPQFWQNS